MCGFGPDGSCAKRMKSKQQLAFLAVNLRNRFTMQAEPNVRYRKRPLSRSTIRSHIISKKISRSPKVRPTKRSIEDEDWLEKFCNLFSNKLTLSEAEIEIDLHGETSKSLMPNFCNSQNVEGQVPPEVGEHNGAMSAEDHQFFKRYLSATIEEVVSVEDSLIAIKPRRYQIELFRKAMLTDTSICVMPTGTGKTVVAAMVMSRMLKLHPQLSALFLVDRVLLAVQQVKALRELLGERTFHSIGQRYSGKQAFKMPRMVLAMKSSKRYDSYRNLLQERGLKWEQNCVVIFDEIHHCKKNHPFSKLLTIESGHRTLEQGRRPKLLGLTASPSGKETVEETVEDLHTLLNTFGGDGSGKSKARFIYVEQFTEELTVYTPMAELVIVDNCNEVSNGKQFEEITVKDKRNLHYVEHADDGKNVTDDYVFGVNCPIFMNLEYQLVKWWDDYEKPNRLALVLVNRRSTAVHLAHLIRQSQPILKRGMHVVHLVGHGTSGGHDDNKKKVAMSVSQQQQVICAIWNGYYNVVVATAVAEEGIDLPECDLVVRIGTVGCVRAFVQIRGRARRREGSRFVVLCGDKGESMKRLQEKEKQMEQAIQMTSPNVPVEL